MRRSKLLQLGSLQVEFKVKGFHWRFCALFLELPKKRFLLIERFRSGGLNTLGHWVWHFQLGKEPQFKNE